MADRAQVLDFPPQQRPRGQDYSTGWMDGCSYGQRFASVQWVWLGVAFGVVLSSVMALAVIAWLAR
jgi:hypothetical protein